MVNSASVTELEAFVRESNRIEGIYRDPTDAEIEAHIIFTNKLQPTTQDVECFVTVIAPGHKLRDQYGLDVQVGNHVPPRGCPEIRTTLDSFMERLREGADAYHPWDAHIDYETLHPFTDGNGRSGRAIWLWQMQVAPIGFLHKFYYQTLSNVRRPRT
jgi:hypothetical protein